MTSSVAVAVRVERSAFLMGTRLEMVVEGETRESAVAASEAALRALEAAEARLSTWTDTSELAALNRQPAGSELAVSPDLWRELAAAAACSASTEGGFDPSVGPLLEVWGVRDGGRVPEAAEIERARAAVGIAGLELFPGGTAARRRPELRLEEGGFGKGAGLDRALEAVAATGGATHAYLDLGGQVALWSAPAADAKLAPPAAIEVGIADPARRDDAVIAIAVESGSISTTGNSERGLVVDGRRLSHVLDPRTGVPAAEMGSVTVWARTALEADCLSTGLYVLGVDGIARFSAEHPDVGVLVLREGRENGRRVALVSASLVGRVTAMVSDLEVKVLIPAGSGQEKPSSRSRTRPGDRGRTR
jgi:thiamine biosynthesis lipoprotein